MARKVDLTGKVAVVTGAARGIGAATATSLAAAGARVAIGDLDVDLAQRTAAGIGDVLALRLDVTDHAGYTEFLDEVERRLGPIDVLVNNAGIMPVTEFADETPESIDRQIAINLRAVIHGCQEAIRRMKPRGSGHIVNVASVAGKVGAPGVATYCATKHGVVGLSEAIHLELRGTGVEVSCVMPSIIRTELTAGVKEHPLLKSSDPEDVASEIVRALQHPHFDVFVPRAMNGMNRVGRVIPRRASETIFRVTKADVVLANAAHSPERKAYEERAAGK